VTSALPGTLGAATMPNVGPGAVGA
jgi:hypothetical protein